MSIKQSKARKKFYKTAAGKKQIARHSKRLKKLWKNKAYRRARLKASYKNFCSSKALKRRWKNKKFHAKMCIARKKQANTKEYKENNRAKLLALWADPKYRARMLKRRAKSRKYKNRHKKVSATLKRRYASGEIKVWCDGLTKHTSKSLMRSSKKKMGRIPERNTKNIYYRHGKKKIKMRSWWEVAYAEYLDKNKIKWKYEPRWFNIGWSSRWRGGSYTPDFWLPQTKCYVEIKGLFSKQDKAKVRAFRKKYPKVKLTLLRSRQLKKLAVLDIHGVAICKNRR